MGLFKKNKKGGLSDVIRCDEPTYLIWKWRPSGVELNENPRENAIRRNSVLRVKDGEVAVFAYKQRNGTVYDFIEGPLDKTLKTANLPILSSIIGLGYEGDSPFQAEVYFINLANIIQIKFAVPYFEVFDYYLTDYSVPVAVRGTVSFKISDYKAFIKAHRLINFDLDEFKNQIKDAICRYVKQEVSNVSFNSQTPVLQIERHIGTINDLIETSLSTRLEKDFCVAVSGVDINALDVDKQSENYAKLIRITKDLREIEVTAQSDVRVKDLYDRQKADAQNYAETLRVQREESQYATHMHTRSTNINAYQIEKQAEVGVAGAAALGEMGKNGTGNVELGNGSAGFNPAAIMTQIAIGGVVGRNIANVLDTAITPRTQPTTPPPVNSNVFFVAINNTPLGPFSIDELTRMATSGQFNRDSLVWRQGMATWQRASEILDLQIIFANTPPPLI